MTDMIHPSLEDSDEFGGLDHLVLPGQDPAMLKGIHAALLADLEPGNFIERMLVRDIAIEAARLEYVRMAECAAHHLLQEEGQDEAELMVAGEPRGDGEDEPGEPPPSPTRNLARSHIKHISLIASIVALVHAIQNERDRLITYYDHRTGILQGYQDALALLQQARDDPAYG